MVARDVGVGMNVGVNVTTTGALARALCRTRSTSARVIPRHTITAAVLNRRVVRFIVACGVPTDNYLGSRVPI